MLFLVINLVSVLNNCLWYQNTFNLNYSILFCTVENRKMTKIDTGGQGGWAECDPIKGCIYDAEYCTPLKDISVPTTNGQCQYGDNEGFPFSSTNSGKSCLPATYCSTEDSKYDIKGGNGFIQIGEFRLGNVDGRHFSISGTSQTSNTGAAVVITDTGKHIAGNVPIMHTISPIVGTVQTPGKRLLACDCVFVLINVSHHFFV